MWNKHRQDAQWPHYLASIDRETFPEQHSNIVCIYKYYPTCSTWNDHIVIAKAWGGVTVSGLVCGVWGVSGGKNGNLGKPKVTLLAVQAEFCQIYFCQKKANSSKQRFFTLGMNILTIRGVYKKGPFLGGNCRYWLNMMKTRSLGALSG